MPAYTQYFGLLELLSTDSFGLNNYQFSTTNLAVIDALLEVGAVTHVHDGKSASSDNPSQAPTLSQSSSGGSLPAGTQIFYEYTYANPLGLETAPSPVANITTPAPISTPSAPTVTPQTGTGTLPAGVYQYIISAYLNTGTNETGPSQPTTATLSAQGQNVLTYTIPTGATGVNIYRMGPTDSQFLYLSSSTSTSFTDNGSYSEQCNRSLPTANLTNSQNTVTVTIVAPPSGWTANIYRTTTSGSWGSSQIATGVTGTTFTDTGVTPNPVAPPTLSRIPNDPAKIVLTDAANVSGQLPWINLLLGSPVVFCTYVTLVALPANTYANGSNDSGGNPGYGATLTATANGALSITEGPPTNQTTVYPTVGSLIFVGGETTTAHNGYYVVTEAGTSSTPWVLTRVASGTDVVEMTSGTLAWDNASGILYMVTVYNTAPSIIQTPAVYGTDGIQITEVAGGGGGGGSGFTVLQAAAAVLTATGNCSYDNGTNGVGATLTASANGALVTDGYTAALGDRILVSDGITSPTYTAPYISAGGMYTVTQVGSTSAPWILTRSSDCDTPATLGGSWICSVTNGTLFAGAVCTSPSTFMDPATQFVVGENQPLISISLPAGLSQALLGGIVAQPGTGFTGTLAIGLGASALNGGTALGTFASTGTSPIGTAVGSYAAALGMASVAVGGNAVAWADRTTAIGTANAYTNGLIALSSGAPFSAQVSMLTVSLSTSDSTATPFYDVDNNPWVWTLQPNWGYGSSFPTTVTPGTGNYSQVTLFEFKLVAISSDASTASAWEAVGLLGTADGTTWTWHGTAPSFSVITQDSGASSWSAAISLGTATATATTAAGAPTIVVNVTGAASTTIYWVLSIKAVEVSS